MRIRYHSLIFLGMGLGAVVGYGLWTAGTEGGLAAHVLRFLELCGGTLFIGALKMLVAPLILFTILAGVTSLPSTGDLGRIGVRTLLYYFATTSIAVAVGLLLVLAIQPGKQGPREEIRAEWSAKKAEIRNEFAGKVGKISKAKEKTAWDLIEENLKNMIVNPFTALAEGKSLGVIFFALVLGIALVVIGERSTTAVGSIQGINHALLKLTGWVMAGAPFFVFCLVASLVAKTGPKVFESLAWYCGTVIAGIAVHVGILLTILKVVGRRSPLAFLRGIRRAWAIAFSTRSSAATLPVTLRCVTEDLEVDEKVADFVLPVGATVNMDGTALYEGVAVIFLIQLFGGMPGAEIALTPVLTVVIFLTAVLASIGAAAIPDAGLVTMVLVANAVGLDADYIWMIFAVDAFLDMFRTSTNVMGDAIGAVVVDRLERKADPPKEAAA